MGSITGTSTEEIEAPIEQVWDVVEDVLSAPDWQGGLKDMEELERDAEGHVTLAETSSDAKVRTLKSTVRFAYAGPERLEWRQEKGEMKSVEERGSSTTSATAAPGRPTGSRSSWGACSAWSSGARWSTRCAGSS